MAWQPQPEPVAQLAQCLRESLSGHNVAAQRNAEQVSAIRCMMAHVVADDWADAAASKEFSGYQQLPRLYLRDTRRAGWVGHYLVSRGSVRCFNYAQEQRQG